VEREEEKEKHCWHAYISLWDKPEISVSDC
jgi:hypothetical protein